MTSLFYEAIYTFNVFLMSFLARNLINIKTFFFNREIVLSENSTFRDGGQLIINVDDLNSCNHCV